MFKLGQILISERARQALREAGMPVEALLHRHQRGDWGEVSGHDARDNNNAVDGGGPLLSHYTIGVNTLVFVLTDDRRSVTRVGVYEDL